jgi:hypothetical protein
VQTDNWIQNKRSYTFIGIASHGPDECNNNNDNGNDKAHYANVNFHLKMDGWLATALNDATVDGAKVIPTNLMDVTQFNPIEFQSKNLFVAAEGCAQLCDHNPRCQIWGWKKKAVWGLWNDCVFYGYMKGTKTVQFETNDFEYGRKNYLI